jgi:hypothetical protein
MLAGIPSTMNAPVRVADGDPGIRRRSWLILGGPGMSSDYMTGLERLAGDTLGVVTYDQRGAALEPATKAKPKNGYIGQGGNCVWFG